MAKFDLFTVDHFTLNLFSGVGVEFNAALLDLYAVSVCGRR